MTEREDVVKTIKEGLSRLQERDPRLTFRVDEELGIVRNLHGNLGRIGDRDRLRAGGLRFVKEHPELFGKVEPGRMIALEETDDPVGGHSLTLQQYHAGHPVMGGSIRFHTTKDGVLDSVSNRLFPDLASVPKEPRIDEETAIKVAQRATKCKLPPMRDPQLLVYRYRGKPHLAWEVRIQDEKSGDWGAPAQWYAYVDAITGRVLVTYDNTQTAGPAVGSGTGYYSGPGSINVWFNDTIYQLRDTTRTLTGGPEIITNDEDGASPSEDADDNWNDLTSMPRDANQGPEVDAHRYAGAVVDYFRIVHARNSFNGTGGNVVNLVHVGTNFDNGYWDGAKINLGDGSGAAPGDDYECSDDWLAHELTHGYTQFTCALAYLNESGALNESFSDVFAAFITSDWLVFEDTWLKASAPAWRNMIDPTNGGQWNPADPITGVLAGHQPSHYSVRYTGAWDNGGVHINSGIINNLFYLLTVGGTHTVSGVVVSGIGQSAAEQLLWRCMSVNLVGQPNATFLDFREAMLDACHDLFPTDLFKLMQVKAAFNAVGIGPDLYARDNLADTGAEPYGGSYLWASPDIINRQAPAANPAVDFADLTNDALWENVEFGQTNYVYVRVQNRGPESGDVTISVYLSAATTFGTPASWTFVGTLNEVGIAPGTMRVSGPLMFPAALIPSPGHYCMIAVLSSALDPAPDTSLITSVSDYLDFVRGTNNIAYRNMDVVDLVPGTPGTLSAIVSGFPGMRERFDLRIDLGRFLPEARVVVRAPARMLNGAAARGLKLVAREDGTNVYEVLVGRELARNRAFLGLPEPVVDPGPGFDGVLVEEPFEIQVAYAIPGRDMLRMRRRPGPRRDDVLAIRQLCKGEAVGAVGYRFRAIRTADERAERSVARPARRR
jgi:thermolysin